MTLLVCRILITTVIVLVSYFAIHRTWTGDLDVIAFFQKPAEIIPVKDPPKPVMENSATSTTPTPASQPNVTSIAQQGGITAGVVNVNNYSSPAPWGMPADKLALLTRRMAPFAPKDDRGDQLITAVMGDAESMRFSQSLVRSFRDAGWTLGGSGYSQAVYSAVIDGVRIILHSPQSNPPGLSEFVATLRESGIEPIGEINPDVPVDQFRIVIGSRPQR